MSPDGPFACVSPGAFDSVDEPVAGIVVAWADRGPDDSGFDSGPVGASGAPDRATGGEPAKAAGDEGREGGWVRGGLVKVSTGLSGARGRKRCPLAPHPTPR